MNPIAPLVSPWLDSYGETPEIDWDDHLRCFQSKSTQYEFERLDGNIAAHMHSEKKSKAEILAECYPDRLKNIQFFDCLGREAQRQFRTLDDVANFENWTFQQMLDCCTELFGKATNPRVKFYEATRRTKRSDETYHQFATDLCALAQKSLKNVDVSIRPKKCRIFL